MKDKVLASLINKEIERQNLTIDLIASENCVSRSILDALGTPLVNKYSEGYPGKRYYPGNKIYDEIEELAKRRALKAFRLDPNVWHVNVQPYSGSPANIAIYLALMNFGDTLMGMELSSGGHLTHGHPVSFSGKAYKVARYGVDFKTGLIDFAAVKRIAKECKPRVIVSGFTAYPREIDFAKFGKIARSVGAYHVADISHIAGLVVAGVHPSPFPYADVVMATTHKTLRGPRGAIIFARRSNVKGKMLNVSIAEAIDKAVFPGIQGGPHNNVTAAKALAFFEVLQPSFKKYQRQIVKNAKMLAEVLTQRGFELVSGGTDTHLMLVDLRSVGLDGLTAEKMLEDRGIIANRNTVPGDKSPFRPSGIRLGTPAVTTRGMKEGEMKKIANLICRCLIERKNVSGEVIGLCKQFPLDYSLRNTE